jgi:hypothetical protein
MKKSELKQIIREEIKKITQESREFEFKELVQKIPDNVAFDNYLDDPNYFYGYVFSKPTESKPFYQIKIEYPENKKGQLAKAKRYELIPKK